MNDNSIFPNFTIKEELNSGFHGKTILLIHNETKKVYLCKSFEKTLIGNENEVQNFLLRFKKLDELKLPYVVTYNQIIELKDSIHLIRPYIDCETLVDYIENNPNLDSRTILSLWRIIVECLNNLHNFGIYSLPLKPTNILIHEGKFITLIDIYEPKSDSNVFHSVISSDFLFFAPEFFTKSHIMGRYSDIWSLGTLLCYMCKTHIPWNTKNIFSMIKKISTPLLPLITDNNLNIIVQSIFKIEPFERPSCKTLLTSSLPPILRTRARRSTICSKDECEIKIPLSSSIRSTSFPHVFIISPIKKDLIITNKTNSNFNDINSSTYQIRRRIINKNPIPKVPSKSSNQ